MAYTTIDKGSKYFNTKLYTGNGGTQSITGVGFQPDLVWIKDRVAADYHWWTDAIRGATKTLHSNVTLAESTQATSLTAFGSSGFTLGSDASVNRNGDTFVSWNWLGANTTASNTSGSITSTVSANPTAGFSIVSYTGTGANATVGHGLGVAPDMIICKSRTQAQNWAVYHSSLGNTKAIFLDGAGAASTSASYWNNTSPTSTVFTVGNSGDVNFNAGTQISYCFSSIKGYSKIGSFVGNGSTDGTFVYTGFKPAFVIQKKSTTGSANAHWRVIDSTRSPYNVSQDVLFPSLSSAETNTETDLDILSNGFKIRNSNIYLNESGITYIYMAFAENPFVTSKGIPTTAR